jgi:hypothetical protein
MCGRYLNKIPVAEIARIFGTRNALPNYRARYSIAPSRRRLEALKYVVGPRPHAAPPR